MLRPASILGVLDKAGPAYFPAINDARLFVAASRLTGLRATVGDDWAVAIERFGFLPNLVGDDRLVTIVSILGSRVSDKPVTSTSLHPIKAMPGRSLFAKTVGNSDLVPDDPLRILIRTIPYALPSSNLKTSKRKTIDGVSFARAVAALCGGTVLATEEELSMAAGGGFQVVARALSWEHPDIFERELPSHTESFRSLAQAIVSRDPLKFDPGREPNSHWKHWTDTKI